MQTQYFLVIIASVLAFVQADKFLTVKPPHLNSCRLSDPSFNKCLARNFQTLFVEWKDGIPGFSSLGKLDPLLVKRVKIVQDNARALSLNMDLQNVLVSGASKAIVQETKLDTNNWIITAKILAPLLNFDSDYKVKGHVLALPLNGNGKARFSAENAALNLRAVMRLRDDGDYTFSEIESLEGTIDRVGNFHVQVDNLFNGQADLEKSANELFNENWHELYESLRPAIEQTLGKILEDRLKKVFHIVPGNFFIEDIPKAAQVYG